MPKQVIEIVETPNESQTHGFNIGALISKNGEGTITVEEPTRHRGPGRPPKHGTANSYIDSQGVVPANGSKKGNSLESHFEKGYANTAKLLVGAIAQSDMMYQVIDSEIQEFHNKKGYGGRNRMQNMSEFMNTQVSLINTKVGAIRELNSIRNKINDLVMKKTQMDKDSVDENSDKAVMDAYYALINSSNYGLPQMASPLNPASINTGVNMSGAPVHSASLGMPTGTLDPGPIVTSNGSDSMTSIQPQVDPSFENYKNNLTPVQRKMILDKDPNIKTVVVYDQSTGHKYFDVINVATGQSVPGVQKPADFLLDTMRIDARNGLAVNSNVNQTYPLVLTGTRAADEL